MVTIYPPDLSGVERKVEEGIKQLRRLAWYQKPRGIFLLGFFSGALSSAIVAIIFKLL